MTLRPQRKAGAEIALLFPQGRILPPLMIFRGRCLFDDYSGTEELNLEEGEEGVFTDSYRRSQRVNSRWETVTVQGPRKDWIY